VCSSALKSVLQCVAVTCSSVEAHISEIVVSCDVLQRVTVCVAVSCSVLQARQANLSSMLLSLHCVAVCVAACCNLLRCVAVCCGVLHPSALWLRHTFLNSQCVAVCCSVLQCVVVCCSVLRCVAVTYSIIEAHINEFCLNRVNAQKAPKPRGNSRDENRDFMPLYFFNQRNQSCTTHMKNVHQQYSTWLQHPANTLQYTAALCNTLQHTTFFNQHNQS